MKCSLGISNFLDKISSVSHSIVFLCFFALISGEGFLISPCYSLELWIQTGMSSFSPLPFTSLLLTAKASSDNHFTFFAFLFLGDGLDPCLLYNVHSSSGTLSVRSNPLNLSLPLYNRKGFDLLLGRKVMTNLGSILKSRDITLPTKVCLVKALVFQ